VTSQERTKRIQIKDNQHKQENKYDVNSGKVSLDKESELVKKKQEEEKSRKRSRGPYRKSNVN